jgi:4-amino-4-deoxy-L-arabinose transferase-like glycosyltransferase
VVDVLTRNAADHTWVAATVGAGFAAGYQLATGLPVMAIGGFTGTDPAPTLQEFRELVADGRIGWFIGDQPAADGSSVDSTTIAGWVAANFSPVTVDGVTLYDLTPG